MRKVIYALLALFILVCGYLYMTSESRLYKKISGNYQISADDSSAHAWHLYIGMHNGNDHFFTIYDNHGKLGGQENPWIVGTLEKTDRKQLIITVDKEVFSSVDSQWTMADGQLFLNYEKNGKILKLTNNGVTLTFSELEIYTN